MRHSPPGPDRPSPWEDGIAALAPAAAATGGIAAQHGFYLAGGTGLSLLLHHRLSVDLDYFINGTFNAEQVLADLRHADPRGHHGAVTAGAVYWHVHGRETLTASFISAQGTPSALTEARLLGQTMAVASLLDIAAMKSVAVIGRSEKKDYVDLAAIIAFGQITLPEILAFNRRKLAVTSYHEVILLRSLVYFDEIEADPMPQMAIDLDWSMTKKILTDAVSASVKS